MRRIVISALLVGGLSLSCTTGMAQKRIKASELKELREISKKLEKLDQMMSIMKDIRSLLKKQAALQAQTVSQLKTQAESRRIPSLEK